MTGSKRHGSVKHSDAALKQQLDSIAQSTRIPVSLQQSTPEDTLGMRPPKTLSNIRDKKLRSELSKQYMAKKRAVMHSQLADEYLHGAAPGEDAGMLEADDEMERTARVTQAQIQEEIGIETARKGFELQLGGQKGIPSLGPYRLDYTRNGRHLLLGGRKGHLAAFDWQTGKLSCEIQVRETVRDVCWLHNQTFFAAAQKKYTYIYDQNGIEIHKLKDHIEVERMQFLPYHFLLATVGKAGYLKYQDTSTGQIVASHRSGLGACQTMSQNPLTAVIQLGHANGTVGLWTPNMPTAALQLLAHRGPVTGISVDTRGGGREMATSGLDGHVKIWDMRMLGHGPRREWVTRRTPADVAYSQRGLLAIAWGTHASLYDTHAKLGNAPPGPYLTHNFPQQMPLQVKFCPYEDVLGVGRADGFSSLIIPGAGEPTFDTSEADPYENKVRRREREVHDLLDKIQPDMITIDPDLMGQLNTRASRADKPVEASRAPGAKRAADGTPYARLTRMQRLDLDDSMETEADVDLDALAHETSRAQRAGKGERERKARGRNSSVKRYLRKKRQNVLDANTIALREKYQKEKEQKRRALQRHSKEALREPSALDVFANVKGPRK
ncbi:putative U3 small nucleolar RNA-associated protein 7 [Malassezia vespertilionis]|uniref:U three protein 7 n=1 Tax=Malassezia vespertilionis TaxID=2020962 RepID=A0A2N1JGA7_9BASI|nr:putative U3 small nucleolar RNA-associated protein 7 [Malassezia vespertilionis]PKI85584.1 Utp7p [Malassezia vespertilionis]WFD05193.1 putative U3 small nucleolar RNA-associated protein 7 [Malassezia vespertilionis]